jgi:DNA-binding response OmpR family regulator
LRYFRKWTIVMMTGYSHKIRVEEARDVGVTEFLVKPFRARDLYARIEQLIEKPRRFVEAEAFFGPDRRRRKMKAEEYKGPKRRDAEKGVQSEEPAPAEEPGPLSNEDAWFEELRRRARDIHGDMDGEGRKDGEES